MVGGGVVGVNGRRELGMVMLEGGVKWVQRRYLSYLECRLREECHAADLLGINNGRWSKSWPDKSAAEVMHWEKSIACGRG